MIRARVEVRVRVRVVLRVWVWVRGYKNGYTPGTSLYIRM
jgi:hypothetical protein